jgi:hypothetical protein
LADEDLAELLAADLLALRQRVEAVHRRLEDLEGVRNEMAALPAQHTANTDSA